MMDILQDPTVWVLFSFVIFIAGAWKFGRKTILAMLDSKIESIRDELRMAENLRIEAQELLAQYQRKFRDATKEADAIVSEAHDHATRIRMKAEADLAESLQRKEAQLQAHLKQIEDTAMREIRAHTAQLVVETTRHIFRDKIDEKANAALIDSSLADTIHRIAH